MRFWKMASLCIYWMMCRERNRTFEGVDRPMCNGIGHKLNRVDNSPSGSKDAHTEYDKELFAVSMRRFLYICCYDSFEFLATLKVS
uniref:X-ray repair cross complementing protein 2, xrcc2 n=1 Tax=Solanum tuberosum TaxID=4113 RepID=M1APD6_SOLTU